MQTSVLKYFEKTVASFPERIGVIDSADSRTFSQMDEQAAGLALRISERVPATGAPIAVYLPKSADALVSFLAILMSGNCYMPLDLKFPQLRIKNILDNINPPLVIASEKHAADLALCGVPPERLLPIDQQRSAEATAAARAALRLRRESLIDTDPAYIINTSGSTGIPKGVAIPHRAIIDYIDWAIACFGLDGSLVIGNQAPFCFDNSTLDIYLSFALGATLVLIPEDLFAFPARLMQYVAERRISFVFWVPSVMIGVANMKILDTIRVPSLSRVLFAGEVMPARHLNYWRQRLPNALYANLYGPTEITVDCTYFVVDRDFGDDEPLPIGFPCRNSGVLILNERDEPCGTDELGELCVRGSSLALGYWNNPEMTAKAFTQNPLNKHYPERIYRTGDLVFRNARGEIMFVGRKDFQIKHMGYRIELGEIEHAVLALDDIANACILYNNDKKEISLFFEARQPLTPAAIRQQLAKNLPKYMLPSAFHQMEELPTTTSGKIDRQDLRRRLQGVK